MGQYHLTANLDRKEFIDPHAFGDGLKLMEFGCSAVGTMTGLAILLASACKGGARGGGDIHPWRGGPGYEGREAGELKLPPTYTDAEEYDKALMEHVVGRWAGDRIAIIGDYHEPGDVPGFTDQTWTDDSGEETGAYDAMRAGLDGWTDISAVVNDAIDLDSYNYTERHTDQVYEGRNLGPRVKLYAGHEHGAVAVLHPDGSIKTAETANA